MEDMERSYMDKDILTAVKEQCISGINEEGLKNTLEKILFDFKWP